MKIRKNMHRNEQIVRVILGIIVAVVAIVFSLYWLLILSGMLLITGFIGYCPLYQMCFLKQCRMPKETSKDQTEA